MNLFLLSHHRQAHLDRTWRLGTLHVCARCLGLYPVLVAGLLLQFRFDAPLSWKDDYVLVIGFTVPGVWDWARGVVDPSTGSNTWRTLSGAMLGVALARSLYIHLQQPFPLVLWVQLGVVFVLGLPALARLFSGRAR